MGKLIKILLVLFFLLVLLLGGCVGGCVYFLSSVMKSNQAYSRAVATAKADPRIQAYLGEPISEGFMPNGNVNFNNANANGDADLTISLSGPKGSGTLYCQATMANNRWTFQNLDFEGDGDQLSLDLTAVANGSGGATEIKGTIEESPALPQP